LNNVWRWKIKAKCLKKFSNDADKEGGERGGVKSEKQTQLERAILTPENAANI
jgi:hypothetical protein